MRESVFVWTLTKFAIDVYATVFTTVPVWDLVGCYHVRSSTSWRAYFIASSFTTDAHLLISCALNSSLRHFNAQILQPRNRLHQRAPTHSTHAGLSGHLDDCKIAAPLHQSHTGGECRMFRQNIPLENTEWLHSACVIRRIECTIAWRSFECFFYSAASGRQKTKTCLQHKNLITCLPASHTYTNKGAYAPPATRRPIECIRCRSTLKR